MKPVAWAVFGRSGELQVVVMEHPFANGTNENYGLTCRPLYLGAEPRAFICQVLDYSLKLTCKARESGGYRCEVKGKHENHWIGRHTIEHALAGNSYSCEAIEKYIREAG